MHKREQIRSQECQSECDKAGGANKNIAALVHLVEIKAFSSFIPVLKKISDQIHKSAAKSQNLPDGAGPKDSDK